MGRCFAACVFRGYVFSDLHAGNFLFDGEFGVIADIGHDVSGDDLVLAVANQLDLLEPDWAALFEPFASGLLLGLVANWGWDSAAAFARLENRIEAVRTNSVVQQSSSAVLLCVELGQWAPMPNDSIHWIAAACALRLSGHGLPQALLRLIRDWTERREVALEERSAALVTALLRETEISDPKAFLRDACNSSNNQSAGDDQSRLELLVVGYMYRLIRRSFLDPSIKQLQAARSMQRILQPLISSIALEQAEQELNSITFMSLDFCDRNRVSHAIEYADSTANTDLAAFERSVRRLQTGESKGLLWSFAWRSLRGLRALEDSLSKCLDECGFSDEAARLASALDTHLRVNTAVADAISAVSAGGGWSPWGTGKRDEPNLDSERAWLEAALELLSSGEYGQCPNHWSKFSAAANTSSDPLRILDNVCRVDGTKVAWSELEAWHSEPLTVPLVAQEMPWHQSERDVGADDEGWPVPESLLANPTLFGAATFELKGALSSFGEMLFRSIIEQHFPGLTSGISAVKSDLQMCSLRAGGLLLFAFDLAHAETSKDFCDRVREPIRRPPPELAAVAATQRILAHGVYRIKARPSRWRSDLVSLDVGWYLAGIEMQ